MTRTELLDQRATRRLVDVLMDLALVSHVRGTNYDPSTSSGDVVSGGDLPGGGEREPLRSAQERHDYQASYRQKDARFFLRRLEGLLRGLDRLGDERAEQIRDEILNDAARAMRDWRRTPTIPGHDPAAGTRAWKIRIANDPRPSRVVAGHYATSHVSVLRYRRQYAGVPE